MKLQTLLKHGYLVPELPYCFTSSSFSVNAGKMIREATELSRKTFFEGTKYSVLGKSSRRRMLEVSHPIPYTLLCKTISDSWAEIQTHFAKSSVSFSQTTEAGIKDKRTWKNDYKAFKEHCIINSSTRLWELKIDIESFYSSVYTHSVTWALHGKEAIKASLPNIDENLLGDRLDRAIQKCQRLETKGIPTGPEAFRIIAELLSTTMDAEFKENLQGVGIDIVGARYVDDCHYFFQTKKEAQHALREFEAVASQYHLRVNTDKTEIIERPCPFDAKWVLPITDFPFHNGDAQKQREAVKNFANLLIMLAIENPKHRVIKKGFGEFWKIDVASQNADIFESLLFRVVLCKGNYIQ